MATIDGVIQYTGKLGQTVGYKGQNGKNYMRVRRDTIKNPKSALQAIQRMIASTVAVAMSYLTEILDNSVEGKSNGAATLNYLRSLWMNMLRNADASQTPSTFLYLPKGKKIFVPNAYILSQGRLASPGFEIQGESELLLNAALSVNTVEGATASQLFPEVRVGDQITVINISSDGTLNHTEAQYCRFAFKNDTTPACIESGSDHILNPEAIDLGKAAGKWRELKFNIYDEQLQINADALSIHATMETGQCLAAGLIVSNVENKQRSTSYLVPADVEALFDYLSGGDVYPTYMGGSTEIDMASEIYLNNSARRNSAEGGNVLGINPMLPFQLNTNTSEPLSTTFFFTTPFSDQASIDAVDFVVGNDSGTAHITSIGSEGKVTLGETQVSCDEVVNDVFSMICQGPGAKLLSGTITLDGVTYQLGNA